MCYNTFVNQAQILRKMTGEARLEQAFYLSDLTRELAMADIREKLGKKASSEAVLKKLRERLGKMRMAEKLGVTGLLKKIPTLEY